MCVLRAQSSDRPHSTSSVLFRLFHLLYSSVNIPIAYKKRERERNREKERKNRPQLTILSSVLFLSRLPFSLCLTFSARTRRICVAPPHRGTPCAEKGSRRENAGPGKASSAMAGQVPLFSLSFLFMILWRNREIISLLKRTWGAKNEEKREGGLRHHLAKLTVRCLLLSSHRCFQSLP